MGFAKTIFYISFTKEDMVLVVKGKESSVYRQDTDEQSHYDMITT